MKRYEFQIFLGVQESDKGNWVKYKDIKPYVEYLENRCLRLQDQIDRLKDEDDHK